MSNRSHQPKSGAFFGLGDLADFAGQWLVGQNPIESNGDSCTYSGGHSPYPTASIAASLAVQRPKDLEAGTRQPRPLPWSKRPRPMFISRQHPLTLPVRHRPDRGPRLLVLGQQLGLLVCPLEQGYCSHNGQQFTRRYF